MGLKNLHKNYSKLLGAFKDAGVTLNESQKSDLDTFMISLNESINKTKLDAIKATKKVVSEKLGKEYKKVFESIMEHMAENNNIASKIQSKIASVKESARMARKVDGFLNECVEDHLPTKEIVDYKRLERFQTMFESLKDMLLENDDAVLLKKRALARRYAKETKLLESRLAQLEKDLNESMTKNIALTGELDKAKARELLEEKIKDLPAFEAKQLKLRLEGATVAEVEAKFSTILESVKDEIDQQSDDEEKSLEEEIANIVDAEDADVGSDKSDKESDKADDSVEEDESEDKADDADSEDKVDEDEGDDAEEDSDKVDEDEDDDIELDPSEQIGESWMKAWVRRAGSITPLR